MYKRILIAMLGLLCLVSLSAFKDPYKTADDETDIFGRNISCDVSDYKNGVYYFKCFGSRFGKALSRFKSGHPELRVTAIAGDNDAVYGSNFGYFVNTEER